MKIVCISDKGANSALSEDLWSKAPRLMEERQYIIQQIELNRDETSPCTGCLACWSPQTEHCTCTDRLGEMTRSKLDCDLVIYLSPATFGTFSSTVKNAVDRGEHLFKNKRRAQIVISYGEDLLDEERSTFIDFSSGIGETPIAFTRTGKK
jgi:multimeric flavodoxin WrbA